MGSWCSCLSLSIIWLTERVSNKDLTQRASLSCPLGYQQAPTVGGCGLHKVWSHLALLGIAVSLICHRCLGLTHCRPTTAWFLTATATRPLTLLLSLDPSPPLLPPDPLQPLLLWWPLWQFSYPGLDSTYKELHGPDLARWVWHPWPRGLGRRQDTRCCLVLAQAFFGKSYQLSASQFLPLQRGRIAQWLRY